MDVRDVTHWNGFSLTYNELLSEDVDAVACSQCHQTINEYTLMFSFLVQDHENRRLQLHIYGEEPVRASYPNQVDAILISVYAL